MLDTRNTSISRRQVLLGAAFLSLASLGLLLSRDTPAQHYSTAAFAPYSSLKSSTQAFWQQTVCKQADGTASDLEADAIPLHVAVEESAGHHSEVWPSFVHTLTQLPNIRTSVYLNGGPKRPASNGMDTVIADFYDAKDAQSWNGLLADLAIDEPDQRIDAIVSTTCANTFKRYNDQLLAIHDARKSKFRIICTIHHADSHNLNWLIPYFATWEQRNSLVLLGLSQHTVHTTTQNLGFHAVHEHHHQRFSPETVPIETFVPVFPMASGLLPLSPPEKLSRAVIQGSITSGRRNYAEVFQSLTSAIEADPIAWGYKLPADPAAPFEPILGEPDAFKLLLMGKLEQKDIIPARLESVVEILAGLDYPGYYQTMHQAGILLPAFKGDGYYTIAASSSVAAAVIAQTPLLATRLHVKAYAYLDRRGVVLHRDNVDPIQAIARMRANGTTLLDSTIERAGASVGAYDRLRTREDAAALSQSIYTSNMRAMNRMLRTALPDFSLSRSVN